MAHYELDYVVKEAKKTVKLTKQQAQTLLGFRRSTYAAPVHAIALAALDITREEYETLPADEARRMQVDGVKKVLTALFEGKVELKA